MCSRPLGATDYLAIARVFHTVIIRGIPLFTRTNLSELRRFITCIDTFYDHKTRIACSAATEAEKLFQLGEEKVELTDSQRVLMDDLQVKAGEVSDICFFLLI